MLQRVGAPLPLCRSIRAALRGLKTMVLLNGGTGPNIKVLRGVRQGCPMSPLLFNLVLAAFTAHIQHHLMGVCVGNKVVKWRAFADDLAIYLRVNEIPQVGQLLCQWESITGMRASVPRSSVLPLGSCLHITDGLITVLPENQHYPYMGAQIGYSWKESSWATWGQISDKVDELVG